MNLKVMNLCKSYHSTVLDDISFEIDRGIIGILGENGAGKTTLMEIIATLVKPSTGKVEYDGKDSEQNLFVIRQQIGYLSQKFDFFAKITVEQALDYVGQLKRIESKKERKREVEEKLCQVGLTDQRNKRFGDLSGGMKQRVGIAQAMIGNPSLLLIDEPTVGLDPHERVSFRQLLSELARERVVLLSTHIVEDIAMTSEHLLVLHQGRVNYYGDLPSFIRGVEGKVWLYRGAHPPQALQNEQTWIISSQATAGGIEVRYAADQPIENSIPIEPTLEHAYIYTNRKQAHHE